MCRTRGLGTIPCQRYHCSGQGHAGNLSRHRGGTYFPAAYQIFCKSELTYSGKFIKHFLGIERFKGAVDYVITGEGAYDHQSDSNKGAKVILELFKSDVKQTFLICGKINERSIKNLTKTIIPIELSKYFASEKDSKVNYKEGIEKACREVISQINF